MDLGQADARPLADAIIRDGFARVRLAPDSPTPAALYAAADAFFARDDKGVFAWPRDANNPDTRNGYKSTAFREFYELHPGHADGALPPPRSSASSPPGAPRLSARL